MTSTTSFWCLYYLLEQISHIVSVFQLLAVIMLKLAGLKSVSLFHVLLRKGLHVAGSKIC